jgi:putative membrane protein
MNTIANYYDWYKAVHIIAVISWMAAIFYMPRLFVYHTRAEIGSEMDKTFQIMEHKLLRIIMTPSMIVTYIFGFINAYIYGFAALGTWFHIKMTAVLCLTVIHGMLAKWRKDFLIGENKHSERFFRIINEVPVLFMVIAVVMVIVKPFE